MAFISRLLRLWSIRFTLIGACLAILGSDLNLLVIRANGNMMPVATMKSEFFMIIGPAEFIDESIFKDITGNKHRAMTAADDLSYLSDRIMIIPSDGSASIANICKIIGGDRFETINELCPFSASLRAASIGNLLIWCGIPFSLFGLLLVLMKGIRQLFRSLTRT